MPRALWITGPCAAELRAAPLAPRADGEALVTARFGGVSRGTERLVFNGAVPESEYERMRAPFQDGDFPFPVKYGYAVVGRVEEGPEALVGRDVFCLHPHQDRFRVPAEALTPLPKGVTAERAVLAANMETALNVVWDAGIHPGDRVTVVGGGVVGALTAWIAGAIPATSTTLIDVDDGRAELAEALGIGFSLPDAAPQDQDVVIHASATAEGLATAINAAGFEARVVEASWHGEGDTPLPLGGAFHSRRLSLRSSQVGAVAASQRSRWTHRRRLEAALRLLRDPRLDVLVSGESVFDDLAEDYSRILSAPETLCHRIRY